MCASSLQCGLLGALGPLEIDLQAAVSHYVHAGNQTWVSGRAVSALTTELSQAWHSFLFILFFVLFSGQGFSV